MVGQPPESQLVRSFVRVPGSGFDKTIAKPECLDLGIVSSLAAHVVIPKTLPPALTRNTPAATATVVVIPAAATTGAKENRNKLLDRKVPHPTAIAVNMTVKDDDNNNNNNNRKRQLPPDTVSTKRYKIVLQLSTIPETRKMTPLISRLERGITEREESLREIRQLRVVVEKLLQEKKEFLQERGMLLQDKEKSLQDKEKLLQEKKELLQERGMLLQEVEKLLQEKRDEPERTVVIQQINSNLKK